LRTKTCIALLLTLLTLPHVSRAQTPSSVVVTDAWVRMPAASKMDAALYMVIENHGPQPVNLISASSKAAAKVEMHEMKMIKPKDDGMDMGDSMDMGKPAGDMGKPADSSMMVMTPIKKIAIPANGKATLQPNGMHMMLFGLKARPSPGDTIHVVLTLDNGTTVPVSATVRQ
jgi:copper(I)-binding protein